MVEFFNTVRNVGFIDNSWSGLAEQAANLCYKPRQWLLNDLGIGSTEHYVSLVDNNLQCECRDTNKSAGLQKIVRMVVSVVLLLPAESLGTSLMAGAFVGSREIRLKHAFAEKKLTPEEQAQLKQLIEERQKLTDQRQGCEPFSCLLVSIVCLLCCLVCKTP